MKKISEHVRKLCFQTRGGHRAQISLEYLSVVGIATLVAISLLALSQYYSQETKSTINTNQIDGMARQIVDTAESVYYYGEPSKNTIEVYIPEGINEITVGPDELNFKVRTNSGVADMSYSSSVTLQGNISISYGFHKISIEARDGYVWINST